MKKNNRKVVLLLSLAMILQSIPVSTLSAFAATKEVDETQYEDDVIYISSASELTALAGMSAGEDATVNKVYALQNDIDLTDVDYVPIPVFAGTLEGNGHKIKGLKLMEEGTDIGLIRFVGTRGVIQNLVVEADIQPGGSRSTVGGIAGTNKGTIINCTFSGNMVAKKEIGGIAGVNEETGTIISCMNTATLLGTKRVGGIVGNNEGLVQDCTNLGEINHTALTVPKDDEATSSEASLASLMEDEDKIESIGGIAGISTGIVTHCDNKATISYKHTGYQVGGIVGYQNGCVERSTNSGLIFGRKDVGGIVGLFEPYIEIDYDEDTFSSLQREMDDLSDMLDSLSDATRNAGDLLQEDADMISNTTDELRDKLNYYKDYYKDKNKDFDNEVSDQMDDIKKQIDELDFSVDLSTVKKDYKKMQDEIDNMTKLMEEYIKAGGKDTGKYQDFINNAKDTADKIEEYIKNAGASASNDQKDEEDDDDDEDEEDTEDSVDKASTSDDKKDSSEDDKKETSSKEDKKDDSSKEDNVEDKKEDKTEDKSDDSSKDKAEEKKEDKSEDKKEESSSKSSEEKHSDGDDEQSRANELFKRGYQKDILEATWIPTVQNSQYNVIMVDTEDDENDSGSSVDIASELKKSLSNMSSLTNDVSHSVSNKVKKAQDLQDDLDDLGDSVDDLYDFVNNKKDSLRDDISNTSDDISESNDQLSDEFASMKDDFRNSKDDVRNQMDNVKDQMSSIRGTVKDGVERVRNRVESGEFYYDISEKVRPETGNGRLLVCLNQAEVNGDINGGGVIGRISIELGNTIDSTFNGKFQFNESGERSLHFDRNVCAAVYACQNDSDIFVKNDYAGGIVGRADYGALIGCQNYGNIQVEDGNYAGGIAGKSDNLIRNSYSLCDVEAEEYAGGVVGYGSNVVANTAMSTAISKIGSKAGTIAGDVDADGEVVENLFVDEGQGAVNGVTYIEEATAVKYERLIRDENTPKRFHIFQIRYMAGNEQLKKLEVAYGGAIKDEDIPAIPEKEGCYSYWEEKPVDFVARNITVHAQYEAWQNSVGSISSGQDKATMLAQADFYPGTEMLCESIEVAPGEIPMGYKVKAAYHYVLRMQKDKEIEEIIFRVLCGDDTNDAVVAVYTDNGYQIVETHEIDSYLQFVSGAKENNILVLQKTDNSIYLLLGVVIVLICAIGVCVVRKKKA